MSADQQTGTRVPRCGDVVLHRPTGEQWVVAYVNGGRLAWCGWPQGEAALSDCELVKACDDIEHIKLLKACAELQNDLRGSRARAELYRIATGETR